MDKEIEDFLENKVVLHSSSGSEVIETVYLCEIPAILNSFLSELNNYNISRETCKSKFLPSFIMPSMNKLERTCMRLSSTKQKNLATNQTDFIFFKALMMRI